jgi:anti-sigma regulatory factor (Ser/Thr protein kinase)
MPQLSLPANLEQLAVVNSFLEANIPKAFRALLPNVELVAEELLVNVFSYAYPEGNEGHAEVTLREVNFDGTTMLCFTVKDWGGPFDPFAEAPAPDLTLDTESRPIGGLCVFLIHSVTAHQAYSREASANIIDVYFARPDSE